MKRFPFLLSVSPFSSPSPGGDKFLFPDTPSRPLSSQSLLSGVDGSPGGQEVLEHRRVARSGGRSSGNRGLLRFPYKPLRERDSDSRGPRIPLFEDRDRGELLTSGPMPTSFSLSGSKHCFRQTEAVLVFSGLEVNGFGSLGRTNSSGVCPALRCRL